MKLHDKEGKDLRRFRDDIVLILRYPDVISIAVGITE
jgi:hypothetical protein